MQTISIVFTPKEDNVEGGILMSFCRAATIIAITLFFFSCAEPQTKATAGTYYNQSVEYSFYLFEGLRQFETRNYNGAIEHFNAAYRLASYKDKPLIQECLAIVYGKRGIEYGINGYYSPAINDLETAIKNSNNSDFIRTMSEIKSLFLIGRSDIRRIGGNYSGAWADLIESIESMGR